MGERGPESSCRCDFSPRRDGQRRYEQPKAGTQMTRMRRICADFILPGFPAIEIELIRVNPPHPRHLRARLSAVFPNLGNLRMHCMANLLTTSVGLCFLVMTSIRNNANASTAPPLRTNMKVVEFLKLSGQELEERTGQKMKRSEKISLRLLRSKMKKAVRRNPHITLTEFFSAQKSAASVVLWILLGGLLLFFFLFLMLFTDDN
jgi:hypothetical protein